ncbi:hypothetical protein J6590_102353 [Homalodisca vitripennis]|nr:hypothetical protein J6590_102353 [Homalodisca vitripennis]
MDPTGRFSKSITITSRSDPDMKTSVKQSSAGKRRYYCIVTIVRGVSLPVMTIRGEAIYGLHEPLSTLLTTVVAAWRRHGANL